MPSFDWYQATIPAPHDDVLEALGGLADGLSLSHARGMHGYAHTAVLGSREAGPVARVLYGGTHEYAHAIVSGDSAVKGAELIRASFPQHSVTRVDVCEDFGEVTAFDSIQVELLEVAKRMRLKIGTAGDHLLTFKGRTVYVGAPSSSCRMRLYDKAAEMVSKVTVPRGVCPHATFGIPLHLTRLEAIIRPVTRHAKAEFASIEPAAALGSAAWMRDVWAGVSGLELEPVHVGRGYRQADDDRAYAALLSQWSGLLKRKLLEHGSWECVGLQLGADIERVEAAKRAGPLPL